jgi:prefoldin subunit 5
MDEITHIDEELQALKSLKAKLQTEIESNRKEIDRVKNEASSLVNIVKKFTAFHLRHSEDAFQAVLGEGYARAKTREFDNAQDYIDYLNQSNSQVRDAISRVDQCIANLEKCKSDLRYQLESTNSWLDKSSEILGTR